MSDCATVVAFAVVRICMDALRSSINDDALLAALDDVKNIAFLAALDDVTAYLRDEIYDIKCEAAGERDLPDG